MSFLTKNLRQRATYWAVSTLNASGDPTFVAPKAIKVRWEKGQAVFTSIGGEEATADGLLFVAIDMFEGDMVYLGVSTAADPTTVTGAFTILSVRVTPTLNGRSFERMAFLRARRFG